MVGKKAFHDDLEVHRYYHSADPLGFTPSPDLPMCQSSHLVEIVLELLHREERKRPAVTELVPVFKSYSDVLFQLLAVAPGLDNFEPIPGYAEWKKIAMECKGNSQQAFSELAQCYVSSGDYRSAMTLLSGVITRDKSIAASHRLVEQLEATYDRLGDMQLAMANWKKLLFMRPLDRELRDALIRCCAKQSDVAVTMTLWKELIDKFPADGYFAFCEEVHANIDKPEDQVAWLKEMVTYPHESWYKFELERVLVLEHKSYTSQMVSQSSTQLFDELWQEILRLVMVTHVSLTRELRPVDHAEQLAGGLPRDSSLREYIKYVPLIHLLIIVN